MYGISGFYQSAFDFTNEKAWEAKVGRMKNSLAHGKPDESGVFICPHAALAHARLPARNSEKGLRPVTGAFRGNKCTIVYNGEIYNGTELKSFLGEWDLEWKSFCDMEIILNGYMACGTDFFRKLNGIFAFCIYDESGDKLILARDQIGVKPLFYQTHRGIFVFGSEQKALFAYGIKPRIDAESWGEVIGLGPARTPGHGVYKDMKEVLPGHFLEVSAGSPFPNVKDAAYWELRGREHTEGYDETAEKVSWLVYDSIKMQMAADAPICTFLSGGLDSSLVSAICQKELRKQGKNLNTFSFEFKNNAENFRANDFQAALDRPFVDIMVSHIGSGHTYLECGSEAQADYLHKVVDARDLPGMGDIESSLMYFCGEASKSFPVALTGESADEIFGGYPWFQRREMWERKGFPWSYDMKARTALLRDDFISGEYLEEYARAAYDAAVSRTPAFEGDGAGEARRREIAWLNVSWFMMTLLNRMDRAGTYFGLEARVPFADYRILEYVYNIPWEMKCKNGEVKSLLKAAGKEILPREILYRKKSPYPKTYDPLYEKMLGERLMDTLSGSSPLASVVDKKKAEAFIKSSGDYGRPWYGQLMAGPQLMAYYLQIGYWMEKFRLG